jgi:hypothetical protein
MSLATAMFMRFLVRESYALLGGKGKDFGCFRYAGRPFNEAETAECYGKDGLSSPVELPRQIEGRL